MTWHAVGILRANDQLTESEYQNSCEYRQLFCLLYRKPEVSAVPMDGTARGAPVEAPERLIERAKAKMALYESALDLVVRTHGRAAKDAWVNIAVYDRQPRWMRPVFQRPSDVRECALFRVAMKAIDAVSRIERAKPQIRAVEITLAEPLTSVA